MHLRYAISPGHITSAGPASASPIPHFDPTVLRHPAHTVPDLQADLLAQATRLAAMEIDFFLLREPTVPAGQMADLSRALLRIFGPTRTRLLLHSRADIAAATRVHGVHLSSPPGSLTPDQVRAVYASTHLPPPTVSLSCHTREDLEEARILGPDLILFGPVFGKTIAGQLITPPTGLESLRQACRLGDPIPVLALGGVTYTNTPACLEAGAAGIAAIRLFQHPSRALPSG